MLPLNFFYLFSKNKRGQLDLGRAPQIVLVVGLVFLIMATLAFVASKYGDAIEADSFSTHSNSVTGWLNQSGYLLASGSSISDLSVSSVLNGLNNDSVIDSINYEVVQTGNNYYLNATCV